MVHSEIYLNPFPDMPISNSAANKDMMSEQ